MNSKFWIPAIMTIALLSGCGGGDTHIKVQASSEITKGMELTDLQRALNEGAISQDEYDDLREIILRRDN